MEVAVHSVIAAEVPGMPGPAPGDPAFERSGAAAELAAWDQGGFPPVPLDREPGLVVVPLALNSNRRI